MLPLRERAASCDARNPVSASSYAACTAAAVSALQAETTLATSSLWVTAQRRFIYLEGCVADAAQAARAEALVRALPDVDQVIPALALPGERAPYARAQP